MHETLDTSKLALPAFVRQTLTGVKKVFVFVLVHVVPLRRRVVFSGPVQGPEWEQLASSRCSAGDCLLPTAVSRQQLDHQGQVC